MFTSGVRITNLTAKPSFDLLSGRGHQGQLPRVDPQKVASRVKLFLMPIFHITTLPVPSLLF